MTYYISTKQELYHVDAATVDDAVMQLAYTLPLDKFVFFLTISTNPLFGCGAEKLGEDALIAFTTNVLVDSGRLTKEEAEFLFQEGLKEIQSNK